MDLLVFYHPFYQHASLFRLALEGYPSVILFVLQSLITLSGLATETPARHSFPSRLRQNTIFAIQLIYFGHR